MKKAKKIAEDFTSKTFGTEIPHGFCFLTCFPMSILFDIKKITNSIICGFSPKNGGIVSHTWLTLDDGTILDPTIRQFDPQMEQVYRGKLICNEITKKFTPDLRLTHDEILCLNCDNWAALLRNDPKRHPNKKDIEEAMNLMNVKTASVLYGYINKLITKDQIMQTKKSQFYFSPIFKLLRDKSNTDKNFIDLCRKSIPEDFDVLLSKALYNN